MKTAIQPIRNATAGFVDVDFLRIKYVSNDDKVNAVKYPPLAFIDQTPKAGEKMNAIVINRAKYGLVLLPISLEFYKKTQHRWSKVLTLQVLQQNLKYQTMYRIVE